MPDTQHCDACLDSDRLILRVEGPGNMQQAPAIREAVSQAIDAGVGEVLVDLRDCSHMDSTFIGTLVHLWKQSKANTDLQFAIIGPGDACKAELSSMGLDKLLPCHATFDCPDEGWQPVGECLDRSASTFKQSLVDSHEHLAQLPGPTGQVFRRVADQMRKELGDNDGEETVG